MDEPHETTPCTNGVSDSQQTYALIVVFTSTVGHWPNFMCHIMGELKLELHWKLNKCQKLY